MTHARLVLVWTTALLVGCKGSGDEGSSTGTTGTTGTSTGATTMASTGSSTSAPTTSGATTDGEPPKPYCGQACMVDADCCFGPGTCPTDEYPHNARCDAAGVCQPPQCSNDEQCTLGGTQPNKTCHVVGKFSVCVYTCQSDADCEALPGGLTCSGVADQAKFCAVPDVGTCMSDSDCMWGTGDRCDVANGVCYCESDDECTATTKGKCAGL